MKTFIGQMLAFLDIGENAVRVSIVQYAAQARTEFFLDQFYDLQDAQDAVAAIEYMGGYTLTGKAIDFATRLHFDVRKGARADVTKIAVVITDGISQDDVKRPARRMRQAGIVTIAIGVGTNLDSDQLLAIAGDEKTLLSLDDFDRLQDLTTKLPTMLCDVGTSQQIVVSICITTSYDVALLNANSSASTALFQQVVQAVTTTFTSSAAGVAAIQPIGFAPGCGEGVVSTVQCAVAPFALDTVSDTFQNLQVNFGDLTIDPAQTTVVSAATRTTIIVTVELTLTYTEDLQDTSSQTYVDLSVTIENAILQVFSANPADIQSVSITSVAPGASATSTSVTVSVVTLGANVDATTRVIINTTAAGVQLGNLPVVSSTVGDTIPPCSAVADIVFVVDGTGSVGLENFERMKTFIGQMLAFLDIGENAVRVSIVQYAAQARTEFFLDQFYDLQDAQDAVAAIEYMGGYTLTGKAIDFATRLHFDVRKGARADVTKIAVVITDGISQDDVKRPARRMRQAGIVTIAIGVGTNLDSDQLLAIAGDEKTLLSLDDFDSLQDLTTKLPTMLCDVGTSQQIVVSICITTSYDVALLNANSSASTALFQQVVQAVTTTFTSSAAGVAAIQPIGFAPGCGGGVVSTVQCAVAPFALDTVSDTFQNLQVNFGDLTIDPAQTTVVSAATRTTIIVTVELTLTYTEDLQDTSSQTYVDLSVTIENAILQVFSANPADIQSVSITSVAPGASATSTSVTVSVVTLGANVDATTRVIINTTAAGVQLGNLPVVSSTVGDTIPPCSAVADIVFVVDGTGSVGLENFERMKTFIGQMLAFLDIGENAVRVSIVQYAAQARTEFFLDQFYDLQDAQDAVAAIEYMGGYTLTGKAIDFATRLHFDVRKGARADVTKIAVVITDGISQDDVKRPARRMRQAGIVTIAIGVGTNLDSDQLLAIAGDEKTLLSLDDFDRLQDLTTKLPTMLCDVGTSQQIVVSICITTSYDVALLNANSSASTALFQQVVQAVTTTFTSSAAGVAAIQPIGFAPGCGGGVVSTVQCAVAPFALDTVSDTFQNLQVNFGDLTIDPAQTTVVSAATRTTIIVTVELTLTYTEDLQDTSSQTYVDLSVTIENAILQVFSANPADIQSVSITSVAPGASATSTSVTVSVVTLGANVDATTRVIINTTAAGVQLGNLPVVSSTVGDTIPPCSAVADIVFVVDGTGSVGLENFERMKTFIGQMLAFLDIGENAVRVSIVQYAAQARTEFFLDQFYDLQDAQDAVAAIEYMGGYTLTGKAIDFATRLHFDVRKGARADVTKIAVVITDGISQDDVKRPARRMRQAGIVTIAIGVGTNLDSDQLLAIAGDEKTLLSLDDFDRLQDLTTKLPTMLCDVGTSQQIVVSICITTSYDVALLNANSSASTALFQQVVQAVTTTFTSSAAGVAAIQPIGFAPGCGEGVVWTVQCAVAPFALDTVSDTFQNLQVNFGDLTIDPAQTTVVSAATRTTIIVTVELTLTYTEDLQDTSSQTYVDLSVTIENAILQVFSANPADIQSVSITSVAPGASATSTSVTVSVVTLGANVDATTRVIINTTAAGVQLGNLPVVSSTVGDTIPPCSAVADIVFVVDGTGSVGLENFERMKTFIGQMLAFLDIGENAVRVSIVQYAAQARTEFFLDQFYDLQDAQDAVAAIEYMGGYTLTGKAIDFATRLHFDVRKGARADVTKIAVVITDGISQDDVKRPARRMRQAGIVTIAIGVGTNLDSDQLLAIAGDEKTLLSLDDFDRLQDLTTKLPTMLCDGKMLTLVL
ncbi:collagen alpha-3(VI) chain-like [Branchiostoma lanceolatum]|uniref:collagen alpha-3(VI) chain-like n=1 Tax=Branchiostoma lanceolatum TaxID=7740 RepID=UPI0034538A3D